MPRLNNETDLEYKRRVIDIKSESFCGEIYWLNSNHTLLTDTLGWTPKISLSQGLDKTIEIWKSKYVQN